MSEPDNPYAAPEYAAAESLSPTGSGQISPGDRSMFSQILVVGILQTVVGGLELLMGGVLAIMAAVIPMSVQAGRPGQPQLDPVAFWVLSAVYGGLGSAAIVSACLRLASGISSFYFRRRMLLLVSLIFGLITSLTCYCALTSTPLAIYGMIIMTSPAAKRAFAMRKAGLSPTEIRRAFQA